MTQIPISAHGVIGDLHTAALIATDGSVDWCCLPRFDSPSTFAALLDDERGGRWRIAPTDPAVAEQKYLPGTNVLVTSFRAQEGGVLEVLDFMPVGPRRGRRSRLFRRVRSVRGAVPAQILWQPRLSFATRPTRIARRRDGLLATDNQDDVASLTAPAGLAWEINDGAATASLSLAEGEQVWLVMCYDEDEVRPLAEHDPDATLDDTVRWWDAWLKALKYEGPYRGEVERSALALKLCCYEPTGAVIAAPTTSLPESTTGGRTWDYRYVWLRDAAFVLHALDRTGFTAETDAFMDFLKRVCRREDGRYIQIMYACDARRPPEEKTLEHLRGWRGLGPVRVGNGAVDQFQMDVYGEVLATAAEWARTRQVSEGAWAAIQRLVEWTCVHWEEPDFSIWEPRYDPRHHTFSKIMAWVTLDHGAWIAEQQSLPGDTAAWRREAAKLRDEILEKGVDKTRETFTQVYGEPQLDAALLVVPKVRFLPRGDARVKGTLAAIRAELATPVEELIYRYRSADGLTGDEGAFVFCSFWMIDNLALTGELDEAERLFKNLLRRASPLGLFAEEIDPATGEHMGNYPQALSHAALINTALLIEQVRHGVSPAAETGPAGLI